MPPRGHASLGPSSAGRWLTCTASVRMAEEFHQPKTDSTFAEEGTAAHALAELEARRQFLGLSEDDYAAGLSGWRESWAEKFDEDAIRENVLVYVDEVGRALGTDPMSSLLLEQRMETGVEGCWGTGDAVVISPSSVHILDLKYGMGVLVGAVGNPQLRLYGLGGLETFGSLIGDIEKVTVTIVQPRLDSISSETLTASELLAWRDEVVIPAVREIDSGRDHFQPSESACRFCPVAGECIARRDFVLSEDFGRPPDVMSPEELADVLSRAKEIREFLNAAEAVALQRAFTRGEVIPGWKVVMSGGRRVVSDPPAAIQTLIDHGFSAEDVAQLRIVPIGQLERLVGKKELPDILGGLLEKSPGRPALVPLSDRRKPVRPEDAAAAEFAAIEE